MKIKLDVVPELMVARPICARLGAISGTMFRFAAALNLPADAPHHARATTEPPDRIVRKAHELCISG